jgi:ligand-binding sensor domain-containing protein
MKKPSLVIAFLFVTCIGFTQTGNYFLSHFSPEERYNITCFDIVQDERGVFYFATQAGVLQFDGRNWDMIPTKGALYSLAMAPDGQIYVAGSEGFGKIGRDEYNHEVYQQLHTLEGSDYIFEIVALDERIYFLSEKTFFEYNPKTENIKQHKATGETGIFYGLHQLFGKPYVSTELMGLVEIGSSNFMPSQIVVPESAGIIFSIFYNGQSLIATDASKLYLTVDQTLYEIKLQDSVYAKASVVVNATWVNKELVALGTLRGGILFINPQTGATVEIINYNTGFPDNEVFALVCDKNQNVWAAHTYGFTRIAPYLPFRSFRYYPGLRGNVLCATTYNSSVYVGTSAGLFKLEKEEFYDEITYYVEIPIIKKGVDKIKSAEEQQIEVVEEKQSKKGLFGFLRKKKKEDDAKIAQVETEGQRSTEAAQEKQEYRREKRTKRILRKAHFVYKEVKGVESKISQLIHWKGKLIAAGLGGAFEIGEKSKPIIEHPVRFLFASEKLNKLIAATHDDRLHQYVYDTEWREIELIKGINNPINYIFEEDTSALWFCGFDKIFRMDLTATQNAVTSLRLSKNNFGQPLGIYMNNRVFIVSSSGFYFYDSKTGTLVEGDTTRKPVSYFGGSANLWFRDKHNWYSSGAAGGHNNLQLLNLFNNIRFISADKQQESLWIITGDNELLQFNSEAIRSEEVIYPLILKEILQDNEALPTKAFIKLHQDKSGMRIEVVRPDFIGAKFVEYRYYLQGLSDKWTEWSTSGNEINFPFLPVGEYKLLVQAKDIFGRVNELAPISIDVEPPYWKQTWFYAAEFSVFLFLVLLSFRLSYRFIFISRVLSLLSIIIFIEFIQTIAGSTFSSANSPVFDFVIQVGVAFIVLPVEGFLRRYFMHALTKRNQAKLQKLTGTDEEELKIHVKTYQTEDEE